MDKQYKTHFEISNDTRKFEIDLFWRRALFFWGFITLAFIGYYYTSQDSSNIPFSFMIACFGLLCSFFWTLTNRGSKFWQENWEGHIQERCGKEIKQIFFDKYKLDMKSPWAAFKFSPSRLTIALSDYVVFIWYLVIVYELAYIETNWMPIKWILLIITIFYCVFVFVHLKNSKRNKHHLLDW